MGGGLGCGANFCKLVLIILNIGFFLLGIVLLALGLYVRFGDTSRLNILTRIGPEGTIPTDIDVPSLLENGAYTLMAVGGFLFVVGFLGCCGAKKEVRCFLILYGLIVFLILIIEIAGAIACLLFWTKVSTYLYPFLNRTIAEKYEGPILTNEVLNEGSDPYTIAWDVVHLKFQCCGLLNHTDFENYAKRWTNRTYTLKGGDHVVAKVPPSCCIIRNPPFNGAFHKVQFIDLRGCLTAPDDTNTNMLDCKDSIYDLMKQYSSMLGIVGLVVTGVELFALIFACCLQRSIARSKSDYNDVQ